MHRTFFIRTFSLALFLSFTVAAISAKAQESLRDTLQLSLSKAEELFMKNNLNLIVSKYEIGQAQAEVITARLFNNPEFTYENMFYNPETKRFFETSSTNGQYQAQLSQLFTLAGKRNKNIRLAESGVKLAEFQFSDLLRTLRFTLRSNFYKLHFQLQSASVYNQEISSLKKTLQIFEQQYTKGNIALKEVHRIKSLLYTLQGEQNELYTEIEELQTEMRQLLRSNPQTFIIPEVQPDLTGKNLIAQLPYKQLIDSALQNRPDLKAARGNIEYADLNLRLQKAMAVPDINLFATYDLRGSSVDNYSGLGISLPLPLFNRNQGAIKHARIGTDISKTEAQNLQEQVAHEVTTTYVNALRLEQLYNTFDPKFTESFQNLLNEVDKNYQKRNISLLEFLDFYDSYKQNAIQMNSLHFNRINSLEELNYVTGTSLF